MAYCGSVPARGYAIQGRQEETERGFYGITEDVPIKWENPRLKRFFEFLDETDASADEEKKAQKLMKYVATVRDGDWKEGQTYLELSTQISERPQNLINK
ncbi:hypothetical protein AVEN_188119-1 [Araneus ventricosus]|uniref:Uncharacterized protein n=1 Tax=Araneus ventricosus TaxID=182803 RepID=A0A4Y2TX14_ARAVE|nr:hypothetical protein AVEN_188119-1 [Araneus ventricosus]